MPTLLEKAKEHKGRLVHKSTITKEELELGLAWAKGEITQAQIKSVLPTKYQTGLYKFLAECFKSYVLVSSFYAPPTKEEEDTNTYKLNRKCGFCSTPIADHEFLKKKFCNQICKKRYHQNKQRDQNAQPNVQTE